MARARNIKPSFFHNEDLVELPFEVRLLFVGLWTLADREGRLEDRPKRIKMAVFPGDDVNVDAGLDTLQSRGFVIRYESHGMRCIQVINFTKHQNPHHRESPSELPEPPKPEASPRPALGQPEASPADSLIPDSLIPDSGVERVGLTWEEGARDETPPSLHPDEAPEPEVHEPPPATRQGLVCRLLRQAGIPDAAPHHLTNATWAELLAKRTDEEIIEFAKAKREAYPEKRLGLKYLAPGLLEDAKPITGPPNARGSPRSMTRDESRRIASSTRLADYREACEAENRQRAQADERTIEAPAPPRIMG